MRSVVLAPAVLSLALPLLACGLGTNDAASLRSYSEELVALSDQQLVVRECEMVPRGTRSGRCLVTGDARAIEGFGARFDFRAATPEATHAYAGAASSACGRSGWIAAHPGARAFNVPSQQLPPSGGRGVLHRVWVGDGEHCFDMSFPYG